MTPQERIVKAGGKLVQVPGARPAYQIGERLIWVIPNDKEVLVGYANYPQQQGTMMSLKYALRV